MPYPSTIDAPGGTAAQGTNLLTSPDHANDHRVLGSAVVNIENLLGTTAASNGLLNSYAAGQTPLPIQLGTLGTIVSKGTLNNAVMGSQTATGGTFNNIVAGTPTFTFGSDATGDMPYKSPGGTETRLGIGANGQYLTTNGTIPSWGNAPNGTASHGAVQQFVQNTSLVNSSAGTSDTVGLSGTITLSQQANLFVTVNLAWYNTGTFTNFGDIYLNGTLQSGSQLLNQTFINSTVAYQSSAQYMIGSIGSGAGTVTFQYRSSAGGNAAINQGVLTVIAFNV